MLQDRRRPFEAERRAPVVPLRLRAVPAPAPGGCTTCAVRGSALFGSLAGGPLGSVHEQVRPLVVGVERPLFERGQRRHEVCTIRSGVVRFERTTERGDRRVVRLAGRGDLIGQEALIGLPFADDAIACVPVELCVIPVALVDELSATQPLLRRDLMQRWQGALDAASGWASDLCTGPARRRLLKLLELLLQHGDDQGRIWLPRRELIGAMLDLALETASRLVSQLRHEGVLAPLPQFSARVDATALARALAAAND